jgi:hypothetical protein
MNNETKKKNIDILNLLNINLNNYQKINSKTQIDLYKSKSVDTNGYYIQFTIKNNKYDLEQLIESSIINMLKEFNKDLLENVSIQENENKGGGVIEIYLHSLKKNMGISKKFIKSSYSVKKENSIMFVTCKSLPTDDYLQINNSKYKKITLENFEAVVDCKNKHNCLFSIKFNINIHEDLPIYMMNMRGMVIAKICDNLKLFIEQM